MAEALVGDHALVAGGATVDLYVRPGMYTELIEGVGNGGKGALSVQAEKFADLALAASGPELAHLGILEQLGVEIHTGGGGANCAAGAAYLEQPTTLVTVLGNGDLVSERIRSDLGSVPNLELDSVEAGPGHIPRVCLNMRREVGGDRVLLVRHQQPISGDQQDAFIDRIRANSVGARYLAVPSLDPTLLRPVLEQSPSDLPKAVNPSSAWYGNGHSSERLPELKNIFHELGLLMVSVNLDEMAALYKDEPSVENATKRAVALSKYVGVVVCTFGRKGAIIVANNGDAIVERPEPGVPDRLFKDNGGAGDAYFIGTLSGLAMGQDLGTAMEQGREIAGLTCMNNGAHGYTRRDRAAQRSLLQEAA